MERIHYDLKKSGAPGITDELPLPCDYFDLIGGTSTGGYVAASDVHMPTKLTITNRLIALMLGRLRMSVDEATKAYAALSDKIFSKDNMKKWKPELFKASTLEAAFKKIVADQLAKLNANQGKGTAEALERMMDPRAENEACKT